MKPVFFPTNSPQSENPLVDEQEISHLNKNQWDHSMSSFNREAQGPQYSKFSQSPQFSQFSQSSQSPQSSRSSQFGSNSRLSQAPISQDPHRSVSSLGSLGKSLKQANGRFQSAQNLRQTQENFDNGSAFNSESKSQFQSQAQAKSFYSPKQNIPPFFSKKPSQSTNGVQTPIMQQPSLNRPIYPTREPNNSNFQNPRQSIPRAIPSNATRKSPSTNARNKVSQNKIGHANIIIVGCGGAGNNTVDRMMKIGIRGAYCVAINTDQQHLNSIIAHKKVLIGRQCTRGLGAGGEPEIGQQAAEESRTEIESILKNGDLIFITCGMGGGTGTGSAPIVAEIAKNIGAIVVGVVTMPFDAEMGRKQKAKEGVAVLRNYVDTLVMIENNRLLSIAADLPINDAFNLADEVLATMVKGITETISLPSIINLDYADIRSILTAGGVAIVGIGESDNPQNRVQEAVDDALNSPLLDFDISGAKGALIHIIGGPDLTLEETTQVADVVTSKMDPDAMVIWGTRVDPSLTGSLQVMLLITGVKSPQVIGNSNSRFISSDFSRQIPRMKPSLAADYFNIAEIGSINEKSLNLY